MWLSLRQFPFLIIQYQTLLGVTGSGKTFTMANAIAKLGRPALVISHNKTLAAQLANEFRELLPNNAVEYFVSYYDYYQPEAYVPQTDTFIEKDSSVNSEVERLRHSATNSLLTRRDVVVVATVSCIYGLGTPQEYVDRMIRLRIGDSIERQALLRKFVDIQYFLYDWPKNWPAPASGLFWCSQWRIFGNRWNHS